MQSSSPQVNDIMIFKDEILKKIRLLESKFTSDFNLKFSQYNNVFEQLETKINTITQNNNTILELITKQDINYEKFTEFDNFKIKVEQDLLTHEIKIKNIMQDIEKLKLRYDKILDENLLVPGLVGPGGIYKNLADYIQYQMNEFQKLRNETEQNKNKLDNFGKNALKVVNNSFTKFQKYTDEKNRDIQIKIERKYNQFSEQILELENEINKYQYKIEKQIKPMQNDVQKLIKIVNEPLYTNNIKFEEINQKINRLIEEFDIIKMNNKDLDSKISYYKQANNSDIFNTKNNSKYKLMNYNKCSHDIHNIHNNSKSFANIKKLNKKSSKNVLLVYDNEFKNISINNELPKLSKDIMAFQKNNILKEQNKELKNDNNEDKINKEKQNEIINNNTQKQITKNKEDNININNNSEELSSSKEKEKEKEKGKEKEKDRENLNKNVKNIKNISQENENDNSTNNNISLQNDKYIKKTNDNIRKQNKIKYIDKGTDGTYLSQFNAQSKTNNSERIINNKINKIGIDGIYKQNNYSQPDIFINIKSNKIKKEEDKNKELHYLNQISQKKKIISFDKLDDKNNNSNTINTNNEVNNILISNKNNNNNNNNLNNINNNISTIKPNNNNYSKINNINKNINKVNLFCKTSKNSFFNKKNEETLIKDYKSNKKKYFELNMNVNEEQKQIMQKIRDYYNNKKNIMGKQIQENIVDCNIINLNMNEPSDIINIKFQHSSAKNSLFSLSKSDINENRKNLREISMKLSPNFRSTNYKLFRNDKIKNIKNSSFDNKTYRKESY